MTLVLFQTPEGKLFKTYPEADENRINYRLPIKSMFYNVGDSLDGLADISAKLDDIYNEEKIVFN